MTNDAARLTGLLKPNQLERFRVLFPTRQSYGEFVNNLTREQRMFQTRSTAFGNSTTAKQLAHAGQEEPGMMEQIIGAGVSAKTGGLGSVIQAVRNWGRPSMNEPTSETLAEGARRGGRRRALELVDLIGGLAEGHQLPPFRALAPSSSMNHAPGFRASYCFCVCTA